MVCANDIIYKTQKLCLDVDIPYANKNSLGKVIDLTKLTLKDRIQNNILDSLILVIEKKINEDKRIKRIFVQKEQLTKSSQFCKLIETIYKTKKFNSESIFDINTNDVKTITYLRNLLIQEELTEDIRDMIIFKIEQIKKNIEKQEMKTDGNGNQILQRNWKRERY